MIANADLMSETTLFSFGVIVTSSLIKKMILSHVSHHVKHLPDDVLRVMPPHSLFIVQRDGGGIGIFNDLNILDDGPCCWVEDLEDKARLQPQIRYNGYEIIGYVIWCIVENIDTADDSMAVYVSMRATYKHKIMVSNHRLNFNGDEIEKPENLIPMMEEYEGFIH